MFFFYLLPFFSSHYHHVCRALDTVRNLPSDVERLCDRLQFSLCSPLHRSKIRAHLILLKSVGNFHVSTTGSSLFLFVFFLLFIPIPNFVFVLIAAHTAVAAGFSSNVESLVRVLFRRELDRQCNDRRDRCFANRRYHVRDTPRLIDLYLDHHALVFSRDEYRVHKIDN